jgi:integrase
MKYQLTKDKFLSESEDQALLTCCSKLRTRDELLIMLARHSGARADSELLALPVTALDPATASVYVRGSKNSNDREIPLPLALFNALWAYKAQTGSKLLFPISYSRLVQIWDHHRPVNKKFHSLRHTFAMDIYRRTKDIKLVQRALGHKSIQTTMIYLDYDYSIDQMKRILA